MGFFTILALAVGLAMDAFAVAITVGGVLPRLSFRPVFRLAWHFGLFQFLMPIVGWLIGAILYGAVSAYGYLIVFGLLVLIGGKMIYESFRLGDIERGRNDPTRGWSLMALAIATSIDALAVGLSVAMMATEILLACVAIGLVAGAFTICGMYIGGRLGRRLGSKMELLGGLVLIGIGIKVLLEQFL